MAEVFRAVEHGVDGFERDVAIKRIFPHIATDPAFVDMFNAEAKLAVQLRHGNIAEIYKLDRQDDTLYIALEFVDGRDLRTVFELHQQLGEPVPIWFACYVMSCVCEGLDYAHFKQDARGRPLGLIHRDVSPPNIMVSFDGLVKLIDFGLAKFEQATRDTQVGVVKGKLAYLSPEQAHGKKIDHRSDVFSTGIVLFELLTGHRLFIGENDFDTLGNIRACEIPRPSSLHRKIPWRLERIVFKALAQDREQRYATAGEMHRDLEHFLITAGIRPSREKVAKFMQRTFGVTV